MKCPRPDLDPPAPADYAIAEVYQFRDDHGVPDTVKFFQAFSTIPAWSDHEISPPRMQLFKMRLQHHAGLRHAAFKRHHVPNHALQLRRRAGAL